MIDDKYIEMVRNMLRDMAVESLKDGGQTPLLAAIVVSEHPVSGQVGDGTIVMADLRGSRDQDEFKDIKDEFAFRCRITALAGRAHAAIFVSDAWFAKGTPGGETLDPDKHPDKYIPPSKRKDRIEALTFITQCHDGRATMEIWPYYRKGRGRKEKIEFDDPEVSQLSLSDLGGRMVFITTKPYPPPLEMYALRLAYKQMGLKLELVQPGGSA